MIRKEKTRTRTNRAGGAAHITACTALAMGMAIAMPLPAMPLPAPPSRLASLVIAPPDEGSATALRFGSALAARGDLVAIGAPVGGDQFESDLFQPGEAIVVRVAHERGWSHTVEAVIRSPSAEFDGFGASLALAPTPREAGECLLVGGPEARGCGTVYAFVRTEAPHPEWTLRRELAPPHGQPGSEFGGGVASGGPRSAPVVAVSARRLDLDGGAFDAGAVHLFALSDAVARQEAGPAKAIQDLLSPSPQLSGWFGSAIAISDRRLAVSAPGERVGALAGAGTVHLYDLDDRGIARYRSTVHSPRPAAHAWFGAALALDGARLVVGEPLAPSAGVRCGRAWSFDLDAETADPLALDPPLPQAGLGFGQWLAARGGRIVVSAPGFDGTSEDTGIAWSFDRDGRAVESFEGPSGRAMSLFGWQVAWASSASGREAVLLGHLYVDEESTAPSTGCALFDLTPAVRTTVRASAASPPPIRRR